ncbi:MAG: hypothetical protein WC758_03320 [Candidatus Woesearchaeota archaeon]|jgi:hypothetical protein
MNELEFNILLDEQKYRPAVRGFESGHLKLKGARIYSSDSELGGVNSLMAIQKEGLIPVPTYVIMNGRGLSIEDFMFSDLRPSTWLNWIDTHAERDVISISERFDLNKFGLKKSGRYVVDIQNGGLFVNRPEIILDAINNRNNYNLKDGAINITKEMKNTLFGEGMVYSWNDGKIELVKPDFMGDYDSFLEASNNSEFLKFKEKEGRWPIYVVLRPVNEARKAHRGFESIGLQLNNPDLIIPIGGKVQTRQFFIYASLKYNVFKSWNDGYACVDRGRQVFALNLNDGISGGITLVKYGGSVGVAPDALRAFYEAKK